MLALIKKKIYSLDCELYAELPLPYFEDGNNFCTLSIGTKQNIYIFFYKTLYFLSFRYEVSTDGSETFAVTGLLCLKAMIQLVLNDKKE